MPLSKGATHALDYDSRLVPLPVMAPLQRTLEDGLRHAVPSLTGGGLTERSWKRAILLTSCGGLGVRHKMTPESPNAQFEKSMAPTCGHNSTRRPPQREKRAKMGAEEGTKCEIVGFPPFRPPPFGPLGPSPLWAHLDRLHPDPHGDVFTQTRTTLIVPQLLYFFVCWPINGPKSAWA